MKTSNTKEKILNVSLKLFAQKSYNGASIREIAKEIGIRESAIYNHFQSKDEILNEIISSFSKRNFGSLVLTDKLINNISKPEKFFQLLANNLLEFWNIEEERMFIKLLMSKNINDAAQIQYSLYDYFRDFEKLCSFIFKEMMNHKFIRKNNVDVLSKEFLSPLFLMEIEMIFNAEGKSDYKLNTKKHAEFFWLAVRN